MKKEASPNEELQLLKSDDIYYSPHMDWEYMSVSQFKDFEKCEAAALAKLKGEWSPPKDPIALLVGNYVHSYFEGVKAHQDFLEKNKEKLFKKAKKADFQEALDALDIPYKSSDTIAQLEEKLKGQPKIYGEKYSDFDVAEEMIKRLEREPFFQLVYKGEREVPIIGNLYGIKWKAKIDLLNVGHGYFIDLKTSADIHKRIFSERYGHYKSFVEAYGYDLQIAVYEKLLEQYYGKPFEGYIFAVSKQSPCDAEAIQIKREYKDFALNVLEDHLARVEAVKLGKEEPRMCGKCEYCRENKKIEEFKFSDDLV